MGQTKWADLVVVEANKNNKATEMWSLNLIAGSKVFRDIVTHSKKRNEFILNITYLKAKKMMFFIQDMKLVIYKNDKY